MNVTDNSLSFWTNLERRQRRHLRKLALRSKLEEPSLKMQCCVTEIAGKGGSGRFWKGEGKNRAGGAQCDGRAGGYEKLVHGRHPVPNTQGRDMGTKFMKVTLSSLTEKQNWVSQGAGGKLRDLRGKKGQAWVKFDNKLPFF